MIARYVTWALIALCPLLLVPTAALWLAGTPVRSAEFLVPMLAFAGVGAVLIVRRPQNAVGWLCYAIVLTGASSLSATAYATHALVTAPGSLPGGAVAAWWAGWIGTPFFLILTNFLPLLFPTGQPPSPRWRPLLWASFAYLVLFSLSAGLAPGPLAGAPEFENPFGVAFLGEAPGVLAREILFLGQIALSLACLASIVVRYRHARSLERQQLKWFTGAFAFILLVLLSGSIVEGVGLPVPPLLWLFLWPLSITAIPITIGIAILRYRLYDIDMLINRTLVYGALTAALAATYFAAVAVLQNTLRPFTGGSELAVAGSTLAVVGLFAPLRSRIQRVVDRRFSRSRYDAARTLDAFSARLRDEVDLDAVRADLLGAVRDTVQPAHAGVWLRERRS